MHNLKDHQKEEMAKLLAKHEAELKNLKEKRQKKKEAQLASINKRLQQQQQQDRVAQQRSNEDNAVWSRGALGRGRGSL